MVSAPLLPESDGHEREEWRDRGDHQKQKPRPNAAEAHRSPIECRNRRQKTSSMPQNPLQGLAGARPLRMKKSKGKSDRAKRKRSIKTARYRLQIVELLTRDLFRLRAF